jgi:hypothetical protein
MTMRNWQIPLYKVFLMLAAYAVALAFFQFRRIEAIMVGTAASALIVAAGKESRQVFPLYVLAMSIGLLIGISVLVPELEWKLADGNDVIAQDWRAEFVGTGLGALGGAIVIYLIRRGIRQSAESDSKLE